MSRLAFLFFSFMFCAQLNAQEVHINGLELLFTDSLQIPMPVDTLDQAVDKHKPKFQDLKNNLNAPSEVKDTLLLNNPIDTLNQKLETAQQKINAVADSLEQKLQVKLPDSLKNLMLKETEALSDMEIGELNIKPLEELKGINESDKLKPLEKIKNINSPVDIKSIPEMEQVNSITDQVIEVKETVSTEKIGETVESKAKNLKGVKLLEEQKGELENAIPDFDNFKDSEHYKEELINTAKEKAVDHFAGHADKLQAAQSKLADIKKKYPEGVSSIKELPKIRRNGMKGKPFKERLVLGLTVQIHPDKIPNVDLSPFAAYKISKRLSLGLGGSYRLIAKPEFKGLYTEGAVYGYRGFTEFMLHKGIFVHAEYEMLKTQVRDSIMFNTPETILEKGWIDGLLLGVGREYKIGGLVNGNMQVLYNLLNEANSPYQSKVMVRFGFSFQLKDKIKKPDLTPEVDGVKERAKRSSRQLMKENF